MLFLIYFWRKPIFYKNYESASSTTLNYLSGAENYNPIIYNLPRILRPHICLIYFEWNKTLNNFLFRRNIEQILKIGANVEKRTIILLRSIRSIHSFHVFPTFDN